MRMLNKIDAALGKLEEWLAVGLLLAILLVACAQVAARNILHQGLLWADIAVRELTFFLGITGAAIATRDGRHINIDVLGRFFSKRARKAVAVVAGLFAIGACLWLALGGYYEVTRAYKNETEQVLGPLKAWHLQLSIPVGFLLFSIHFLVRLVNDTAQLLGLAPLVDDGASHVPGAVARPEDGGGTAAAAGGDDQQPSQGPRAPASAADAAKAGTPPAGGAP